MINPSKEQEEQWAKDRRYHFARFCWIRRHKIAPSGLTWGEVFGKNEGISLHKYARSIVIPDDKQMSIKVLSTEFVDYENILIAPSKGNLNRNIDPADVAYAFGPVYQQDVFFDGFLLLFD